MHSTNPAQGAWAAGADDDPLVDEHFVRYTLRLLWENLGGLFLINVLCLPIAGMALALGLSLGFLPALLLAALAAYPLAVGLLAAICGRIRQQPGSLGSHFLRGIRRQGKQSAWLGLFLHGLIYSILTSTALVTSEAGLGWSVLWLVQNIFLLLFLSITVYALPLLSSYEMGMREALRNGLLLAVGAPLATMAMLSLLLLLGIAVYWIGVGAWLLVPLVAGVVLCSNCHLQIQKRREPLGQADGGR
jgi:uncharacterized membrane protein YesL